ncbi:hypothetical protein PACTADRAFT_50445 [Pachysolen tannophilus NRRL Y-2460]|uniref:Mitochondrial carrier protein RIM2 n=1 Tax=Pachysolen tannophilus NRRL Y-2460 TaxID=669874 RepID=A0A1E4TSB6_PACTA|nr:hypothetical protein PACTADRAFT_50445 [Pachysolen tannophilus NRRL Y-2460]
MSHKQSQGGSQGQNQGQRFQNLEQDIEASINDLGSDEKALSFNRSDIITETKKIPQKEIKPWVHFVAGGIGGMAGAIFTCPLDVVKTRLQSSVYRNAYKSTYTSSNIFLQATGHLKETCSIIYNVYQIEGVRSLFKGLGPNLVGVIPARSINFFTYGLGKDFLVHNFFNGQENSLVHLLAAVNAGIVTSTATNPIWLVKTRLQLDKNTSKEYKNSLDCIKKVLKQEGIAGLYKGLTASYLGSAESTLQWVLYEQMKRMIHQRSLRHEASGNKRTNWDSFMEWGARSGAAGAAKFIASIITYPHEVIRTRLRQAPLKEGNKPKYTGLMQCFRLVVKEEGLASMYGGLTPHLMRTVPNSIIMFGTWEIFTKLLS